jgi:hypothetical protein
MNDAQYATDVVDDLMYEPPRDAVELEHRLGEVPPENVRSVLVERIQEGRLDEIDALVAGRVFDVVGLAEEHDRLAEIVADGGAEGGALGERAREAAFVVLAMNADFQETSPTERFGMDRNRYVDLAASVYGSVFEFTEVNVDVVRDVGGMLLGESPELRSDVFQGIENHRARTDLQAGLVYRPLLEDASYTGIWPMLVDAVVDEGVPQDAGWLERRAERVDREDHRERFRRAAETLRERATGEESAPRGFALVGTPDGAGIFPLFVFTDRSDGPGYDGYHLAFRHDTHEIQEGFALRDAMEDEIEELADEMAAERAIWMTETSVEVGIELARRELEQTDQDLTRLPPETRLGLYELERLPRQGAHIPAPEPAATLDTQSLRETFEEDDCFDSWFYDRGLLEAAGVPPVPAPGESVDEWKSETRHAIADVEGVDGRIAGNFELMAIWYALDGDDQTAGQMAAVAEEADEGFADSLALDLLLDHTIEAMRQMQEYASTFLVELLGDESLREQLRDEHLGERQLDDDGERQFLDYAEMAYRTLEEIGPELPERLRPSHDQMIAVAGPLGQVTGEAFEESAEGHPDQLAQAISDELLDEGIDMRVAGLLTSELVTNGRLLSMIER